MENNRKIVVSSFSPSEFKVSTSGWDFLSVASNPHWQTIFGTGALHSKLFGPKQRSFETTTEKVITAKDNDFFYIEHTSNIDSCESIVVIVHGLESNPRSNLCTNLAEAFLSRNMGCCLVAFRGCHGDGTEDNNTVGSYHFGFTDDLDQVVDILNSRHPSKNIYLCGFSLGGNVVLKFLGEQSYAAANRRIVGAVATCVPFDPFSGQEKLDRGFNRYMYAEVRSAVNSPRYPAVALIYCLYCTVLHCAVFYLLCRL